MQGRQFLQSARRMAQGTTEEDWRTAAGRAYYAALHEGNNLLLRWGIQPLPREDLHRFVRLCFLYATLPTLKSLGHQVEDLLKLRTVADYHLTTAGPFRTATACQKALNDAAALIAELDRLDADPGLRAAAVAAIQAGRPQPPTP